MKVVFWSTGSGEDDFFLKIRQCIIAISFLIPLGKFVVLHLKKKLPFTLGYFVPSFVEIDLLILVLEKNTKCEKLTDRRTDDGQQAIRKAHLGFQLR